jgi:hypothetical protein
MRTAVLVLCFSLVRMEPALAYLAFTITVSGQQTSVKWNGVATYFVNEASSVPGISVTDFRAAMGRAFATWEAVPTASIRYEFGGFTSAQPFDDDGRSTMGFAARPELDRVLGATSILVDSVTGQIVEADIFFNSAFEWSIASAGETGKFDLESIAVHEIGHLNGLGHSAIGETEPRPGGGRRVVAAETVMFPIAYLPGNISDRMLKADDIAGISDVYPDGGFQSSTGSLSGRVTRDGQGLFGVHVVVFNQGSGRMVGGFTTSTAGRFSIGGLSPGVYVVRVEPLDDADVASFFNRPPGEVATDFKVTFFNRLVAVPKGGDSGTVEVQVVAR